MKKKSTIEAYKGMSFSDASLKIKSKYPQADTDLIQKNSLKVELEQLMQFQEKKKMVSQMEDAVKQFKKGGMLPKYSPGGLLGDPTNPKKTFSTLDDQPVYVPEVSAMPPFDMNSLGSGLFGNTQMPVNPNQITPLQVSDPLNTQTTDDTVLTRDNPVTLGNNRTITQPRGTGEMSAYTPALLGQGVSTALNLGILAGGYDKVAPVDNPYESQVIRNMADRGIDTTQQRNQILSAYNAAKDNLSNTRSANVRNALDVNMMNTTQDSLAESKMQEQQLNNNYQGEYANVLNNLGQQKVQSQVYAENATAQNKGQFQSNVSAEGASVANNSQFFTNKKLNDVQNKLLGDILSSKYSNVGLNPEVVTRLNEGKLTPDDITKLQGALGKDKADTLIEAFKLK